MATKCTGGICAPLGFTAAGVRCGLKKGGGLDLAVVRCEERCAAAGVFTRNAFKAAPLQVTMEHLKKDGRLQGVVVNSGNANAWTGEKGLEDARAMAVLAAAEMGVHPWDVAVASTGTIGVPLPMELVKKGIAEAAARLGREGHLKAAEAIMTTDTRPKETAWDMDGFKVGGMAKGAGMIHPRMATMLAFITTDAEVDPCDLQEVLVEAVNRTFNRISVDGCTSTNDMVLALASGAAGKRADRGELGEALHLVCSELARAVVLDGEGATRLFRVVVTGAEDEAEALKAAEAVACSPLVKTAVFGGDPNWGRVVQALGAAVEDLEAESVKVTIGGITVAEGGGPVQADEEELAAVMALPEVVIAVSLGRGEAREEMLGCDLSYDYVRINAEYRT